MFLAVKVGDSACYFQNAVISAAAKVQALKGVTQQVAAGGIRLAVLCHLLRPHFGAAGQLSPSEALQLPVADD
ncbi:MAG: hypothetical protein DDT21_02184 [Syntrophomonadaceae bacterium]|nr:hypothetical protein [Bacillota bacterium]